jgi:hypothetical protein
VRILDGDVDEAQNFQTLINPGLPVAPAYQATHDFGDADCLDFRFRLNLLGDPLSGV